MVSDAIDAIPTPYTRRDLVKWWEARRLRFNLWVGSVGAVTWLLVLVVGSLAVKPGVDFEEPIMMIVGPIIYGVVANICFSFGWIVDAMVYLGRPRAVLYKTGLIFSVVLTALPGTLGHRCMVHHALYRQEVGLRARMTIQVFR